MKAEHNAAKRLLGLYALGELTPEEAKLVENHVPYCPSCQGELRELVRVARKLHGLEVQAQLSQDFQERLLNKVRKIQQKSHQDPK